MSLDVESGQEFSCAVEPRLYQWLGPRFLLFPWAHAAIHWLALLELLFIVWLQLDTSSEQKPGEIPNVALKKFPPPKTHAGSLVPFLHSCCLGGWSWAAAALWAWGWSCLQEGEACVLMEVWRRQMSCLLFLSNQEASLFFRATCLQLEFFFKKRDWIPSPLASVQESLPPNSLSCYFARDAFKPGRTFPVNSSTRGGLSLWTLA